MVDVNPLTEDISQFQEPERPPSEQLVELHLYLVPKEKWLEKRKLAKNQAVDHTISVGFVRVLPQTVLADLRKEMHRQLGIDSVPQSFVFLRSVGRNFTQVRPKQEMEMKVKNYMPPFAPEPELYLKEGQYTGPSNWSQGEDSGLEESLADSNSQRSHDRATPESLTDDPLILPKLTDYLGVPLRPDEGSRASMPPGAMTVSMSADHGISSTTSTGLGIYRARKGDPDAPSVPRLVRPIRPDRTYGSSEDVRYTRVRDRSPEKPLRSNNNNNNEKEPKQNMRASSWNRRQKRGASKERGGTQLPTWAETRTTRLRRSKALGETQSNNNNSSSMQQKAKKRNLKKNASPTRASRRHQFDAEDEAEEEDAPGKFLMERIRANSRCLKAQLSSHHSRRSSYEAGTPKRERIVNGHKNGRVPNGIYTAHTRRQQKLESELTTSIESTYVKLMDEKGHDVEDAAIERPQSDSVDEPDIVHLHKLSVDGEDARMVEATGTRKENGLGEKLENISEGGGNSPASSNPTLEVKQTVIVETSDSDKDTKTESKETTDYEQSEDSGTGNEEFSTTNDLAEGKLVNQNGKLTIEVEVKEFGSSEDSGETPAVTSAESDEAAQLIDDPGDYDSYRVYSEQLLQAPSADPITQVSSQSRSEPRKDELSRINKARQARGVYLRRMEHRNSQSNIHRTQSNEQVVDSMNASVLGSPSRRSPIRRYGGRSVSYNRKSGQRRLEKWSSTAASTGDLREAAWDYSNDKERLLVILNEVRGETRFRQKQREELLRKIKQLQSRAHQRREQGETTNCLRNLPKFAGRAESAEVREMWRKRYLEARKITPRLEEECSRLRQELEKLHRELLAKVQAGVWALLTISGKTERPSNKLSYKIMIARLLQEIEDLTRRVEGTRLKLHTEMKLRSMAEKDVRNLREELLKKKIQVTLTRNQEQAAMGNGLRQQYFISAV